MTELEYSEASVELYARLLMLGPHTPAKARNESGLVSAVLHPAAQELIKDGLVGEDRDGNKTVWYCRDPSVAWLSLAAAATWEIHASLNALEDLAATGQPEIDRRKSLFLEALSPAFSLWKPHDSIAGHRHTKAPNSRILAQLTVEAVAVARTRVRSVSVSPKISAAAAFWPVLRRQLKAGIEYTRLADMMEVYEHGLDVVKRDLGEGVRLLLGLRSDLFASRGYLVDNRLLVRYDAAEPNERPTSGTLSSDRHVIQRFARRFEFLAADAVPANVAIDRLRVLGEELLVRAENFGPDVVAWVDQLIRMGRFATLPIEHGWTDDYRSRVLQQLLDAELVRTNDQGIVLPGWPLPDDLLLELRRSSPHADGESSGGDTATGASERVSGGADRTAAAATPDS